MALITRPTAANSTHWEWPQQQLREIPGYLRHIRESGWEQERSEVCGTDILQCHCEFPVSIKTGPS